MLEFRSYQKELLDADDIPKQLLYQNLRELEFINKYLGGHKVSLHGLKKLLTDKSKTYRILDIGCGGGDSIKAIASWAEKNNFKIELIGVDLKQDCIDFAKKNCSRIRNVHFICDDFRNAFSEKNRIDVVHASLFCHHFLEIDIAAFVKTCTVNKAIFLVNDLERNWFAYYSIKILTKLFSKSPLVKNDAPLSVWRGFKRPDWQAILKLAGAKNFSIKNRWAFRHLVIIKN